jgi:hypothetical protein
MPAEPPPFWSNQRRGRPEGAGHLGSPRREPDDERCLQRVQRSGHRNGNGADTGRYDSGTGVEGFVVEGFVVAGGDMTIRDSVSPSTVSLTTRPGFYDVRLWSWRELYQ